MPRTIFANHSRGQSASHTENLEKLTHLSDQAQAPLYSCTAVFPFTLFPDTIDVFIDKIIITYKRFFFTQEIFPIVIENLLSVSVSTNLFFGSIKFDLTLSPSDPEPVHFLPKSGALKVNQIATGLLVAQKNDIDLSDFSKEELFEQIELIGSQDAHQ